MQGERERGANYPLLDFLRFGAALIVMLSHLRDQYYAPYGSTACASTLFKQVFFVATRLGTESVLLFFVLSGFLVGGISVEKLLNGTFSPRKYAIDRFSRIYTPLVPVLLLAAGVCAVSGIAFTWGNFFVNLFSLQGVFGDPFPASGALWSLSYEVWFYILCGAVICLMGPGSRWLKLSLLILVALSAFVFSRFLVTYLFVWIAGLVAYFLNRPRRAWRFLPLVLPIIVAGIVLVQITGNTAQADFSRFSFIGRSTAILTLGLGFALLLPLTAQVRFTSPRGARAARAGTFLAGFSYSMYLVHLPLEQILLSTGLLRRHNTLNAASLAGYSGMAVAILIASWLFYWCFERQTPRVRRWLS